MKQFPRTEVAGVSLPRMLMGTNWILGYSHTGAAADRLIHERNGAKGAVCEITKAYLEYGIDAMMAPFGGSEPLRAGVQMAEEATGRKVIRIDTPIVDVSDSPEGRASAMRTIKESAGNGATFCLIHHSSVEQLVSKLDKKIDRLPDYLDMIRQNGMIPGLSAHMPELIVYADENEYDVETYIQLYNCMGFLMQVEIESVRGIIERAKKPVMTIKAMAAGRVSPYVGLTFAFNTLRKCDMVTVGAFTPHEVHEDVEIAFAALEGRFPNLEGRASPNKTVALGGEN
jgi:hypothetical protein